MKLIRRAIAWVWLVAVMGHSCVAQGSKPLLDRVEPPSWWSSPTEQEVTLLIEGSGLKGAKVGVDRRGVRVGRVEVPGDGSTMFVDLVLAANVEPGPVVLEVEAGANRVKRAWAIAPRPTYQPRSIGPDDVVYLVMLDRFANGDRGNDAADNAEDMSDRRNPHAYHGGDFAGLKARLPYLADLGVTALWLTPIYKPAPRWFHTKVDGQPREFADFHGYSPVDLYEVNPRFGTSDEYRALVDEAHKIGLKVIQDQIVGFTGPQHRWAARPPTERWFHGPVDKPPVCNFRFDALANPHARESDRRGLTDGWFFGILPDLNTRDEQVKRVAIQQSLWWAATYSPDGIRLDTYPMVDRTFWRDWSRAQKSLNPAMRSIGEAWVIDAADLSFLQGGRAGWDGIDPGVDSVFDFPLNAALVDVVARKASATKLGKALSRDFLYPRPDLLMTFLDNHDTPRLASMPGVTPARFRLAAAFLMTTRGIPQLTWGDEIGLPGHSNDRKDIPGGWKGDPRDAFTIIGRTPEEQATFEAFRALAQIRQANASLRTGKTIELFMSDGIFAFSRRHEGENLVVVLNFGEKPARVTLPSEGIGEAARFEVIYGEGRATRTAAGILVEAPGERAAVFRAK